MALYSGTSELRPYLSIVSMYTLQIVLVHAVQISPTFLCELPVIFSCWSDIV